MAAVALCGQLTQVLTLLRQRLQHALQSRSHLRLFEAWHLQYALPHLGTAMSVNISSLFDSSD
jgi:hypothetical protein